MDAEVRRLDPSAPAERERAHGVPQRVVVMTSGTFHQKDGHECRPRHDPAAEQGARHRRCGGLRRPNDRSARPSMVTSSSGLDSTIVSMSVRFHARAM
jgi:hypothetical protein